MKEQICLFHEQGQTHFPTAFDLEWLKLPLLKTLVETKFSSQGADSSKIKTAPPKKEKKTNQLQRKTSMWEEDPEHYSISLGLILLCFSQDS